MAKKRQRIDTMIDSHLWMRRKEARMDRRPLTLDCVPDELLAECGLRRGAVMTPHYCCTDPAAVLVPLADVVGPMQRKLNRDDLAKILRGFRDGDDIPPVLAFCEPDPPGIRLIHGAHRWRASLAFGFAQIPAISVDRWEAEEAGYQRPSPSSGSTR